LSELPKLIELARRKVLDLEEVVSRTISLDAEAINDSLDALGSFQGEVRTVIKFPPG
jgi:Zn-dependent alcohol dehydrogenase